jgi:hypothetical protein
LYEPFRSGFPSNFNCVIRTRPVLDCDAIKSRYGHPGRHRL